MKEIKTLSKTETLHSRFLLYSSLFIHRLENSAICNTNNMAFYTVYITLANTDLKEGMKSFKGFL